MKISLKIFLFWFTLISSSLVPYALAAPPNKGPPKKAAVGAKAGGEPGGAANTGGGAKAAGGAGAGGAAAAGGDAAGGGAKAGAGAAAGGAAAAAATATTKAAKGGSKKDESKKGGGSSAVPCKDYKFSKNKNFKSCEDLELLKSYLHWNYDSKSNKLEVAFRQAGVSSDKWVSWAINPDGTGMKGAQALVAYKDGQGVVKAYTSPIKSYGTKLEQGSLSFSATQVSGELVNDEMIIYATLSLPKKLKTINHLWQQGPMKGKDPGAHPTSGDNVKTTASLDLQTGKSTKGNDKNAKLKKVHGALNAMSWGFLMPVGAIMGRHVKALITEGNPLWFYLHIGVQVTAFVLGVAGWAIGLKIGSGLYKIHRNLGITLFVFGTLQVLALLLRPKPDHEYRRYWNYYHWGVGYLTIVLSIVNCFSGLGILDQRPFKTGYIIALVIVLLAIVGAEAYMWYVIIQKKKQREETPGINYNHQPGGLNLNANLNKGEPSDAAPAATGGYDQYQGGYGQQGGGGGAGHAQQPPPPPPGW